MKPITYLVLEVDGRQHVHRHLIEKRTCQYNDRKHLGARCLQADGLSLTLSVGRPLSNNLVSVRREHHLHLIPHGSKLALVAARRILGNHNLNNWRGTAAPNDNMTFSNKPAEETDASQLRLACLEGRAPTGCGSTSVNGNLLQKRDHLLSMYMYAYKTVYQGRLLAGTQPNRDSF